MAVARTESWHLWHTLRGSSVYRYIITTTYAFVARASRGWCGGDGSLFKAAAVVGRQTCRGTRLSADIVPLLTPGTRDGKPATRFEQPNRVSKSRLGTVWSAFCRDIIIVTWYRTNYPAILTRTGTFTLVKDRHTPNL